MRPSLHDKLTVLSLYRILNRFHHINKQWTHNQIKCIVIYASTNIQNHQISILKHSIYCLLFHGFFLSREEPLPPFYVIHPWRMSHNSCQLSFVNKSLTSFDTCSQGATSLCIPAWLYLILDVPPDIVRDNSYM